MLLVLDMFLHLASEKDQSGALLDAQHRTDRMEQLLGKQQELAVHGDETVAERGKLRIVGRLLAKLCL
jgi:hypothetical protein